MSKRIQRRQFLGITAAGLALPAAQGHGVFADRAVPEVDAKPTSPGKEAFKSLSPDGIELRGWAGLHLQEDAYNGWVAICNKMSHQGIKEWDPNHGLAIPYLRPWAMWEDAPKLYGRTTNDPAVRFDTRADWLEAPTDDPYFRSAAAMAKSVPFYYDIVEPVSSMGAGEFEGHWMDTLFRMAWPGGVKNYQALSHQCVRDILAARDPSGYIGTDLPQNRFTASYSNQYGATWIGAFEIGGMASIWEALLTYYRFTGDQNVLEAVCNAADRMLERMQGVGTEVDNGDALTVPTVKKSQKELMGIAGMLVDFALVRLYLLTGRQRYLDRAVMIWNSTFEQGFAAQLAKGPEVPLQAHAATTGIMIVQAVDFYRATGDTSWLKKARQISDNVVRFSTQANGVPTSHREVLVLEGPAANTETCNLLWFPWFWMEMLAVTGEARFADLAERCILNALPGTRSKDGVSAPFFARPNQLFALRGYHGGTSYCVRHYIECCKGNYGRTLSALSERMVMTTPEDAFVIAFYSTGEFEGKNFAAGSVKISQLTDYPFSEEARITVKPEKAPATFPVKLRIPDWCQAAQLKINHEPVAIQAEHGWMLIDREWGAEDVIDVSFPHEIKVVVHKDNLVTVERGPFVFALPVHGRQVPIDSWGSFEQIVTPEDKWNYALLLDKTAPAKSFKLRKLEVPAGEKHVWKYPPYGLEVEAVRVPQWKLTKKIPDLMKEGRDPGNVLEPSPPAELTADGPKEMILLIPYGFTTLRMTYLSAVRV